MKNSRIRGRRKRMNIFLPIASMGDIAFLLIIFFMLTSKFMKESHVIFKEAESPDIKQIEDSAISVIVDNEAKIWLQGKLCGSPEDLRLAVERLVMDKKDKVVMLKVDRNIKESEFGPILVSLSKAGVKIAMIGTKSKSYEHQ
ncbi:MAG: hypothetical protein A2X49_17230 [Lentisphaerae bacterium GWF2_52_8]|nr:MAG: hypothetical protein A2X49_17230 [Lentisphaerae bacterium GWF2_52_8]